MLVKHRAGIIKSSENHPSVVMYSIENEMRSTGNSIRENEPAKWERYGKHWIKLDDFVRNLRSHKTNSTVQAAMLKEPAML